MLDLSQELTLLIDKAKVRDSVAGLPTSSRRKVQFILPSASLAMHGSIARGSSRHREAIRSAQCRACEAHARIVVSAWGANTNSLPTGAVIVLHPSLGLYSR